MTEDYFPEYFEEEIKSSPVLRTTLAYKDGIFALLCLNTGENGGVIYRYDPRAGNPVIQSYPTADDAIDWYYKSLTTSQKNGWKLMDCSTPNRDY